MAVDAREPTRNYQIPDDENLISEEFPRLILALTAIGNDVGTAFTNIATKAPLVHTHTITDITGLQSALDSKQPVGVQSMALDDLTDVSASSPANLQVLMRVANQWVPGTVSYANLTGVPSTFTPSAHGHAQTDIVGLTTELSNKVPRTSAVGAAEIPAGTTAERPTQVVGRTRYNTTLGQPEISDGTNWQRIRVGEDRNGSVAVPSNNWTIPTHPSNVSYWMNLSAGTQILNLPNGSSVVPGFNFIIRVSGSTSGYQTARISASTGQLIQYRGYTSQHFYLIGAEETFRLVWFDGVWMVELLSSPIRIYSGRAYAGSGQWNSTPGSMTYLPLNQTPTSYASAFNWNSGWAQVPVIGVYRVTALTQFATTLGGANTGGWGYLAGVDPISAGAHTGFGIDYRYGNTGQMNWYATFNHVDVYNSGNYVGAMFSSNVSTLYYYPDSNFVGITMLSR